MIYVDDLVSILIAAGVRGERLQHCEDGSYNSFGCFFACDDGEFPTFWQLGKRFGRAFDWRLLVWPLWRRVGRTVARVATAIQRMQGKSALLNVDKVREGTVATWATSSQKVKQQLGFEPALTLDEAFKRTAIWYQRQGLRGKTTNCQREDATNAR